MPLTCALLGTGNFKANNTNDDDDGDDGGDDAYDDSDSDGDDDDSGDGGDGDGSPALREHSVTGLVLDVLPVPSALNLALDISNWIILCCRRLSCVS